LSMMYYLAASKELPLGGFGEKKMKDACKEVKAMRFTNVQLSGGNIPLEQVIDLSHIKEDEVVFFGTYEDAAGIFVEKLPMENSGVKRHFKNSFIYRVQPNIGKFCIDEEIRKINEPMYMANKKCVNELFRHVRRNKAEKEEMEFYACWYGEEAHDRNPELDLIIDLNEFVPGDKFSFKEQQYILIE